MLKKTYIHLRNLDSRMCIRISGWNGKRFIDKIMYAASHFGYGYLYPVIGGILLALDYAHTQVIFHVGITSFMIEHVIYRFAKKKIKRLRPFNVLPGIKRLMRIPDEFSFPSGHAAGAFLMATLLNHFYPSLSIPFYSTASLIGFSRVYNGVHYPSDVMAGSVLGFLSARIGLGIFI